MITLFFDLILLLGVFFLLAYLFIYLFIYLLTAPFRYYLNKELQRRDCYKKEMRRFSQPVCEPGELTYAVSGEGSEDLVIKIVINLKYPPPTGHYSVLIGGNGHPN